VSIAIGVVAVGLGVFGAALVFLSAVGVLRLPDAYLRCNAAGKAATLGVTTVLVAAALLLGGAGAWIRVLLAAALLIATVPVATQLLARGAAAAGIGPDPETADHTRPERPGSSSPEP
jgi:multicomponent Na+:H+ antiporter subunit G